MQLGKVFPSILKNTIECSFVKEDSIPIGSSKFGGQPDLPPDFRWYYFEGQGMDNTVKSRPLSFLAQINCQEISKYDTESLLPASGILYFFYELDSMTWGFDPKDAGSAKVFYYDGDISKLERVDFPADLEEDYQMPELKIQLSNRNDLPSYEEFSSDFEYDDIGDKEMDDYDDIRENYLNTEEKNTISKILGYADVIQGEMRLECEEIANSIYCGSPQDIDSEKFVKLKQDSKQWQLLFQLDTVECDDFELMFGDCGRIYYYIRKDDLRNCNFDNCWLILQCY